MKNPPVKNFSKYPHSFFDLPNLIEIQLKSYQWLLKTGLKELFEEISPIRDYGAKDLELYFLDHYFDEPTYDEEKTREKGLTFEAPFRVRLKLANKRTKAIKEQEVYFGDFPMMTPRGTFIINGVERVVISQLIRSSGVYFTANVFRGKKLFGAKVIPNRGVWLEFETDPDNVISVRIDRKRKVPVTSLLRIFGLSKDENILKTFRETDNGEIKYINQTLKKDMAKDETESYLEIYKRLRPGDPATPENAKNLVSAMFFRKDRYDLAAVGRFKLNQRLNLKSNSLLLTLEDLIEITKEIIRLNNTPMAEPDDIDHLGYRRLRPVGELLQLRVRVGLAQTRRIIQDRMSVSDINTVTPDQLINTRPLVARTREFFVSSQLSQFMDQVNPLAELEHKRRVSAMGPGGLTRERAGFEVRDVHRSYYGRICPIQTPEGANIGLISHLSSFARVNEMGFIESPYVKVKKGRITGEIVWLDAIEEEKYKIAHATVDFDSRRRLLGKEIEARIKGEPGLCSPQEVEFIGVNSNQIISIATSLIPFLGHDDANRALMGSNMQRQGVSCIKCQAPLVSTGLEERTALDSGYLIIAPEAGEIIAADANQIILKTNKETLRWSLKKFVRSNQYTCISQKTLVKKGDGVKKGDILADGPSTENGVLALGQNLLLAFLSWEGAVFEDAIVISERVVLDDLFTSIHIEDFYCDIRDTKLGPEITTPDIPNVSEEKLKNLDEEGIIRIGAEVKAGDILVGKISPKGEVELTSEERLLQAIFGEKAREVKDTSLVLPHGKRGRIVGIKIFSRERSDKLEPGIIKRIQVEVAQLRKVQAGDKLAGRHGNKGVISKVVPIEDMPHLADGTPVDIILNPLSVASRMNLGQVLETHLGLAAHRLGYRAITPAFAGATEENIKEELVKAGLPEDGKVILFDGRTGKPFNQSVTIGYIYIMKLNHLVEDKIHVRPIGPYSLITQQPLAGKAQFGGQRFGEMEVWALEGYGAAHTLQEMLTIKSDDVIGRSAAFEAIIRGEKIKSPHIPASFNVLVNELKALGLSVELIKKDENHE